MVRNRTSEIREFILKSFPLARKKQIKDSDALLKSGILDSLGILTVVMFLEKEFSVKIEDEELIPENFETIDQMAAFLENKTAGANLKA
jgi:acyl carrier protein